MREYGGRGRGIYHKEDIFTVSNYDLAIEKS